MSGIGHYVVEPHAERNKWHDCEPPESRPLLTLDNKPFRHFRRTDASQKGARWKCVCGDVWRYEWDYGHEWTRET